MIPSCSFGRVEVIPKTWPELRVQVMERAGRKTKNPETSSEVPGEVQNM